LATVWPPADSKKQRATSASADLGKRHARFASTLICNAFDSYQLPLTMPAGSIHLIHLPGEDRITWQWGD
jgi:hypothetical protein